MKSTRYKILWLGIFAFFLVTIILPLIAMFFNIAGTNVSLFLNSIQFKQALRNSVFVSLVSTIISISIAFIFAFSITRSGIKCKSFFSVFATLPMLIPSMSHGMGLILLFGSNGFLTRLLHLDLSIYGFNGIVIGSVLYSFPVAFLMLTDILTYEDASSYEAANVLGISKWRQFCGITFPYLRKPLISVVFAVFTMVFTDYGVPLILGGKFMTLPVLMYQEVIGLLNFGTGSIIGVCLLFPALIAFLFDMFNKDKGSSLFVTQSWSIKKNNIRDIASYLFSFAVCLFIALPIIRFVFLIFITKYPVDMTISLYNIKKSIDMGALQYLGNSLLIAAIVAILGTILSYFIAYITARMSGKRAKTLHLISLTSLAIPGLVLGLSYVLFFKNLPIYGTLGILIMVNITHFLASPYLMAYNSLGKLNENLEAVGATLNISRLKLIKDVLIPQTFSTILQMISYFFINCMMTISAVSFLTTIQTKPLALMIPEFEAQMLLECSAFVSVLILIINLFAKLIVYISKRRLALS
jgi:iron(III) transport system permease protein